MCPSIHRHVLSSFPHAPIKATSVCNRRRPLKKSTTNEMQGCGAQSQWIRLQNNSRTSGSEEGMEMFPKEQGVSCQVVSSRSAWSYTHQVSTTWLPKHQLAIVTTKTWCCELRKVQEASAPHEVCWGWRKPSPGKNKPTHCPNQMLALKLYSYTERPSCIYVFRNTHR